MIEEEKRLFRKSALKKRAKITNRQEKSAQIAKNLFDIKAYKNASMIFAYMSYRSEADTMPVIEHALAEQKCVAVPRVVLLDGEQGSGLTRGGQHGADAALESGDLLLDRVAGRIGEAGVDALGRHIEQGRDFRGRVEAVGRGLNDRHDARAAVLRLVSLMQAFCFDFHEILPFLYDLRDNNLLLL